MLEVRLLGKFEVSRDGQLVEIPSHPAQLLLAYLILNAGTAHRREKLAGLLWPDSLEETARSNLRQTLWRLQKAVGKDYFVAERTAVAFNAAAEYWLDVDRLRAGEAGSASIEALIEVVSAYGGDLLPGFYEDWVVLEQEQLQASFEQKMQLLLNRLVEARRWSEVLDWAERWIALGYSPEPAYRALMQAHSGLGDRAAVGAAYQRCVKALQQELGVEPSEQTQQLYARLLGPEEPSPEATLSTPGPPGPGETPSPPLPGFLDRDIEAAVVEKTVFIGRDPELARLDRFLDQTLAGRGQTVFVTGEAGQGKTSLLDAFARRAQLAHPDLIVVGGTWDVYTGVGEPFLPFREILSMLSGDIETWWRAGVLSRDHARRLWQLTPQTVQALVDESPELIDTFLSGSNLAKHAAAFAPDGAPWLERLQTLLARRASRRGDSGSDQTRIFEEYAAVLVTLASRQPLLIMLDDLHWADLSSISLLSYVSRRIADQAIMITGAYRPEDVAQGRDGASHPLTDILAEIKRRAGDIIIDLSPGEQAEGRAFVDALLDTEPNRLDEQFRQQLVRHTGGHPLFTVELLRDLQERGDLHQNQEGQWVAGPHLAWNALPVRVEGVIEKRISRLDDDLREVLAVASVEGEEFTAEVIARALDRDERSLVQRLSGELDKRHRLVKAQGLRRIGPGRQRLSSYRFRHNLFQKYLYHSLDDIERGYWHETVGDTLEQMYGEQKEQIAVQLAQHFERAGLDARAATYWQQAGDAAARRYATAEAGAAYRRALTLAGQAETVGGDLTYLYARLGRMYELDANFDEALKTYTDMRRVAQQVDDRSMELASLMAQVNLYATSTPLYDPAQGQTLVEEGLSLARQLDDQPAEAKLLWNLLNVSMYSNRLTEAITYGERSIALARRLNLVEQLAYTLNDIAHCYWTVGQLDRAIRSLREAGQLWRDLDNLPMLADSLSTSVSVFIMAGEYEQALNASEEAYQISRSINNLWGQAYSKYRSGLAHWEQGDPTRAITDMQQAIEWGQLGGFLTPQVNTAADLAFVYGSLGAIELGLETARQAMAVADTKMPIYRVYVCGVLAELHLLAGNLTGAEAAIEQGRHDPNREAFPAYLMQFRLAAGKLALAQGDHNQAAEAAGNLLADLRQSGIRSLIPGALLLQGQALHLLGQKDAAQLCLQEARSEAEAIGSRRMLWRILFELSRLEPDPAAAEALRRQARETIKDIAGNISDAELRASFLASPPVCLLLEPAGGEA